MDHVKQARTGELFSLLGLGALGAVGVAAAHPHVKHHLDRWTRGLPPQHRVWLSDSNLIPKLDHDYVRAFKNHEDAMHRGQYFIKPTWGQGWWPGGR